MTDSPNEVQKPDEPVKRKTGRPRKDRPEPENKIPQWQLLGHAKPGPKPKNLQEKTEKAEKVKEQSSRIPAPEVEVPVQIPTSSTREVWQVAEILDDCLKFSNPVALEAFLKIHMSPILADCLQIIYDPAIKLLVSESEMTGPSFDNGFEPLFRISRRFGLLIDSEQNRRMSPLAHTRIINGICYEIRSTDYHAMRKILLKKPIGAVTSDIAQKATGRTWG